MESRLTMESPMPWRYDDGGRAHAGYRGDAHDCVTRAIAIATTTPYSEVYDSLNEYAKRERPRTKTRSAARTGVHTPTVRRYMDDIGWVWTPTMRVGSGCTVHLRADELPDDRRMIVKLSRHIVAVVDGVCLDTYDPSRDGTRCVYGYWAPDQQRP